MSSAIVRRLFGTSELNRQEPENTCKSSKITEMVKKSSNESSLHWAEPSSLSLPDKPMDWQNHCSDSAARFNWWKDTETALSKHIPTWKSALRWSLKDCGRTSVSPIFCRKNFANASSNIRWKPSFEGLCRDHRTTKNENSSLADAHYRYFYDIGWSSWPFCTACFPPAATGRRKNGSVITKSKTLLLMKELQLRILNKNWKLEWGDIKRDLEALCEVELEDAGQTYYLRTDLVGICGKVFQAAGVAIPPTVRN